jgi:hypothetical protein
MAALDALLEIFLSDVQLIEYISKGVRKSISDAKSQNYSHIVSNKIDQAFEDLQLANLVAAFLEKTLTKNERSTPEYSDTEPTKVSKLKRKVKKEATSAEPDFNQTQYINPQSLDLEVNEEQSLPSDAGGILDSPDQHCTMERESLNRPPSPRSPELKLFEGNVEDPPSFEETGNQNAPNLSPANPLSGIDRSDHERDYSDSDFEVASPDKSLHEFAEPTSKAEKKVNFPQNLVSDTFVLREKHAPEDIPDLFYTQEESMRFQYDLDRETQRADSDGVSWLDWMMERSEEDRLKHEEEDELLQHEYQDYWEGNERYQEEEEEGEESQSGDEMW